MTLGAGATIRVRISTSAAGSTAGNLHDVTYSASDAQFSPSYGMFVLALAAPVSGRYVRLDITD
ncbi:MAG: hypothetical protein J0H08_13705, partial [Rhizobiales bacterium]|nr:hypothetical protein [Hyphomicrobiales bacterium]